MYCDVLRAAPAAGSPAVGQYSSAATGQYPEYWNAAQTQYGQQQQQQQQV
jgi:hypothetical protein